MGLLPDYTRYDDEKLVSLIAQLQEEALVQLYNRYHRLIFSLALAIVNDRATAEEITLDVFMRVWQRAGTYQVTQAKVSTWLTHITRHHAIDILRRRDARLDQSAIYWDEFTSDGESFQQDPQEFTDASLRREYVHAALAQLPAAQKQALLMAYFEGYTQRQIAERLNLPLGTIKTRLRLAMQKLYNFLRDEQELEEEPTDAPPVYNITKEK